MVKCDVCGKTSLVPEKIGNANVCKICFMKANGPFWKYRTYEKYEEAEKQRQKALESATKLAFPEVVVEGINTFFDAQEKDMIKCDACGEVVHTLQKLGKAKICKKCFRKIETKEWKENSYETNEDIEKNRQKVLAIAKKNFFPDNAIDGINAHFDRQIQKGLFRIKNGHRGQILKVYETHCALITTDNFDADEIAKHYATAIRKSRPSSGLLPSGAGEALVRGFLTGGVVKAGVSLATSAAVSAVGNSIIPSKETFRVVKGTLTIQYNDFDRLDYQNVGDNEVGFLRFRNSAYQSNPAEDVVFFFGSSEHIKEIYEYIQKKMNEAHNPVPVIQAISDPTSQLMQQPSVADEILKFKNLLDMGAITKEEFEAKKKELLGL